MDKLMARILKYFAHKYANFQKFKKELSEIKYGKDGKPKISTSKKLTFFLFTNMTIVEVFALYMTYISRDLSVLSILITPIIGEVIGLAIYSIKSAKENSSGGIVYEMALHDKETDEDIVG